MINFGDLTLDTSSGDLSCGVATIHLGPQQFRVLEILLKAKGRTISREHLMARLWHGATDGPMDKAADVHVFRLRRKLADLGSQVEIQSKFGFGVCLVVVAPAKALAAA